MLNQQKTSGSTDADFFLICLKCYTAMRDLESCSHKSAFVSKAHGFLFLFLKFDPFIAASCIIQSLIPKKSISAISLDFLCSEDFIQVCIYLFIFGESRFKHMQKVPCFMRTRVNQITEFLSIAV